MIVKHFIKIYIYLTIEPKKASIEQQLDRLKGQNYFFNQVLLKTSQLYGQDESQKTENYHVSLLDW